jgi:general secretion pathway protein K
MTGRAQRRGGTQRGAAIIVAMGVLALAAIAATAIVSTQSVWAREHEIRAAHAQARALTRGGLDWARAVLADDRRTSRVDHYGEAWAVRVPAMTYENAEVGGEIVDQQGLFNLNNLVRDGAVSLPHLRQFRRLLDVLALSPHLADALVDWLDRDFEPRGANGAEDRYYQALESPYLAANAPIADMTELALVRGFDDATRARLQPFVTALPKRTSVNVNTAPPEVLSAVIEDMDLSEARALAAQRELAWFRDLADFTRALGPAHTIAPQDISVSSDYFAAVIYARVGDARARADAMLAREDAGWPDVLWRKLQ